MIIHDVKQGTDKWLWKRAGIPTASEFDNLITPNWELRKGQMPQSYLALKLAETIMKQPMLSGGGFATDQGSMLEQECIPWYEFTYDEKIERPGFITTDDGRIGCSPDGLIGPDGGIEIKCPQPPQHVATLLAGAVPKEHLAQIHGAMFVTGRAWWRFVSYNRAFPPLVVTVQRDEEIQQKLAAALADFLATFDRALARMLEMKESAA